ncbi:hypothetical protein GOP47_0003298 [Adiantum capillus-veneris]|uniref:Protein EXORDIUM-like 5 n=1 Tax=Adiantum capillus-veneris TaxID=13818 RepID=A0A9D4VCJ8_ADICA|nr:hypothetical protein GOP47_0003298 [Adiantum capillus-veneris]
MTTPLPFFSIPLLMLSLLAASALHGASLSKFTLPAPAGALAGSSSIPPAAVAMKYHMGPVLTSHINIYPIWYGLWHPSQQSILRDFLLSISSYSTPLPSPSLPSWWTTLGLYTDQTNAVVSQSVSIAAEHTALYSHGPVLTRITTQQVIRSSLLTHNGTLPADSRSGVYLVLTSPDVVQQDFCRAVCGFHYFTYPSIVGFTLPYAWIGNSAKQCPETCAYPFAIPFYMKNAMRPLKPPNGDVGVDGMVSVVGHELAEMASNPLINAWYAGADPEAPTEIADLCEGVYGRRAGGRYPGTVARNGEFGSSFNVRGVNGRRFLVQWLWNPILKACDGPNKI